MKRQNYFRLILLMILVIPLGCVIAQSEIKINHSDYFSEAVVTPEQLQVSVDGLPDNDKIQMQLGARKLISNTPVSIIKIDNTSCLLQTQLEYEVSSNIFTFYTYKDAYPESYQEDNNKIEWLYLRTCTDWNHAGGWWLYPRPIGRYHLEVSYSDIKVGTLNQNLGFQGWLDYSFSLEDQQIPEYMIFNDLAISVNTTNFYSVLTSAIISESEIKPIGEYDTYYNTGSDVQLGAIAVTPFDAGDFDLTSVINNFNIHLDGSQPTFLETPYDCEQVRLAPTIGHDLTIGNHKNQLYISIQPDVNLIKQNIIGRTISYPNSLDVDSSSGTYFSPAMVVNQPVPQDISVERIVGSYVQNYNFKTTYRLKFMIYSTLEVKSLNGTVIELGDPLLNIGDRYIDLSFKGVTGADISYGEVPNPLDGITKFFQDLVSTGWGIVLAILMLVAMIALVYVLIRYLIPLIIRKIADKSRKSKPKPIQPTQNRRINRKYI